MWRWSRPIAANLMGRTCSDVMAMSFGLTAGDCRLLRRRCHSSWPAPARPPSAVGAEAGFFAGMIVARPCERTRCVGGKPAEEAPANGLRVETESGAHLRVDQQLDEITGIG